MLLPADADDRALFAPAAVVHGSITLFWTAILAGTLPRRHAFPQVFALPFWPQFADHLAWGACVGGVLAWLAQGRELQKAF